MQKNRSSYDRSPYGGTGVGIGVLAALFLAAFLALIIAPMVNHAPARPVPLQGSNEYLGLGDTPEVSLANLRRAENNAYLNSKSVLNLTLDCKIDIAGLFDLDYLKEVRFNGGPLGTMQASKEHVYGFLYNPNGEAGTGDKISIVFAIRRSDCVVEWYTNILDVSTQAAKILAKKFPGQYDDAAIATFQRDVNDDACFGPIAVHGDYIFTGDGCTGNALFSDEYYNSRPQANGGPILGASWGVTNQERHLLNGKIYVLNRHTGKLVDADRLVDSGEVEAQGYCNPEGVTRMMTPYTDPRTGEMFMLAGVSNPGRRGKWTRIDTNETRFHIGILNGNRETRKGGVLKRFRVSPSGQLTEMWRRYGSPKALFAGDVNPFNASHVFATDDEAETMANYHCDGLWGQRLLVDLKRNKVVVPGGNGLFMPAILIKEAHLASGTLNAVTGGQGYPLRVYREWIEAFDAVTSADEIAAVYEDFKQTQIDMIAAMVAIPGNRFIEYFANSITTLDLDTGATIWQHKRVATDTWISLSFQAFTFTHLDDYQKSMYWGGGGDQDYPMGPLRISNPVTGEDYYMVSAKDGSTQIFHPDTGAIINDVKGVPGQVPGGINYGATSDGRFYYTTGSYKRLIEFLSDLNHITTYNQTSGEITVLPNYNCAVPGPCDVGQGPWFSDAFVDTYNNLGGGAGRFYGELNTHIPDHANLILKLDAYTGNIAAMASRENVGVDPVIAAGHTLLTSANDVLFATNPAGLFEVWNANTMQRLWWYNATADVASLPGHTGKLAASTPMIPVGNEVWTCAGEAGFWGNDFWGKYCYKFSVPL